MRALVVLEHDGHTVRPGSYSAAAFAAAAAQSSGSIELLILGHNIEKITQSAARVAPVLTADHELLATPVADRYAAVIADVVRSRDIDLLAAASTTFAAISLAARADCSAARWQVTSSGMSSAMGDFFCDGRCTPVP